MPEARFAILGMGRWGQQWLAAIAGHEGARVSATASRQSLTEIGVAADPALADARHYRSYRAAIDESDADAIVVTLPVHLHADAITRSLAAGKHVLCEKPMVQDAAELDHVRNAVDRFPRLVVMVSQNYRKRGWAQATRRLIVDGAIGDVGRVSVRFSQPEFLDGGRREMDSPLIDDMSIHHFDLLRFLTGREATEVYVQQYRPPWSMFCGASAVEAVLTFTGGVVANYSGTWAGRGSCTPYDGDYIIEGQRGTIVVTSDRVVLDNAEHEGDGPSVKYRISAEERADTITDLRAVLSEFCAGLGGGPLPTTNFGDNSRSVGMLFAARRSLASGRPEPVGQDPD